MPQFQITYTNTNTRDVTYEIDWVCPDDYDEQQAREAFQRQFPTASIVQCDSSASCSGL